MPRAFRAYLLGCLAITFAYLLVHVREPLRLSVGDPASEAEVMSSIRYVEQSGFRDTGLTDTADVDPFVTNSYHPIHYPPLGEVFYGVIGKLGVDDIGTFRVFALAFSMVALLLLFAYARRMWSDKVALIATMLFAASQLWMSSADSIHEVPMMQAFGFLALWGLVRAFETGRRVHYAAAFLGTCACFLTSYGYWLFLPAAVVFTVSSKRGNVFGRGTLHFVLVCLAGCVIAIAMKALFAGGTGQGLGMPLPLLLRRTTVMLTPLFWLTVVLTAWRALRAPTLRSIVDDGVTWMLVVAGVFVMISARQLGSPVIGAQPLLPFYAIATALLIERLLAGGRLRRALAIAWLVAAPTWSFYLVVKHPRSLLDRGDVAKVNAYLAANDRNDFVMSNLLADRTIQVAFDRHTWGALEDVELPFAYLKMLDVFEATGTDYVHAVIFTTPDSRISETALWKLGLRRKLWSVTGWPDLQRKKTDQIISDYDKKVRKNLELVDAKRVLHLANFDVYRIDRASVVAVAGKRVPLVSTIDFGRVGSSVHELMGWGEPWLTEDGIAVTSVDGFAPCPNPTTPPPAGEPGSNACETIVTPSGLEVPDMGRANRAQLMIRVETACDLRLSFELAAPSLLALSVNDYSTTQCTPARQLSVVVPQRSVRAGINVITLENLRSGTKDWKADVATLQIEPLCAAASPTP